MTWIVVLGCGMAVIGCAWAARWMVKWYIVKRFAALQTQKNAVAYNYVRLMLVKILAGDIQDGVSGLTHLRELLEPDPDTVPAEDVARFYQILDEWTPPTITVERETDDRFYEQ